MNCNFLFFPCSKPCQIEIGPTVFWAMSRWPRQWEFKLLCAASVQRISCYHLFIYFFFLLSEFDDGQLPSGSSNENPDTRRGRACMQIDCSCPFHELLQPPQCKNTLTAHYFSPCCVHELHWTMSYEVHWLQLSSQRVKCTSHRVNMRMSDVDIRVYILCIISEMSIWNIIVRHCPQNNNNHSKSWYNTCVLCDAQRDKRCQLRWQIYSKWTLNVDDKYEYDLSSILHMEINAFIDSTIWIIITFYFILSWKKATTKNIVVSIG